nr:hypothetical protein [Tanacetum cinerariifolium]
DLEIGGATDEEDGGADGASVEVEYVVAREVKGKRV